MDTSIATPGSTPLGLTRDAAHRYTFNDGKTVYSPLPSVTTVVGIVDKSGPLTAWARREVSACAVRNLDVLTRMRETGGDAAAVAWLKTIPDTRDSASSMGTRVHRLVEQLAHGVEPEVTAEEAPFVDAYRGFLASFRPRFLGVEEMVVSVKHRYAGTCDAWLEIDGETWCVDVKTGRTIQDTVGLQLAGYAFAEAIARPGDPRRLRIPKATRFGVIHVRPDGARLIEYRVDRGTFAAFLEARRLLAWQQGPAKSIVGKPVLSGERSAAA